MRNLLRIKSWYGVTSHIHAQLGMIHFISVRYLLHYHHHHHHRQQQQHSKYLPIVPLHLLLQLSPTVPLDPCYCLDKTLYGSPVLFVCPFILTICLLIYLDPFDFQLL